VLYVLTFVFLLDFVMFLFCSFLADAKEGKTAVQAKIPECDIEIYSGSEREQ
jgi:hypothetical protein